MSARDVKAGGAYIEIYAKSEAAQRALTNISRRLNAFGSMTQNLGRRLMTVGGVAAAGLIPVVQTLSSFDDKMAAVGAITKSTEKDLAALRAEAKRLGSTTSFSASQVAEAMTFLGMAGFNTEQILAGIPSVLNLAKAGVIELGEAADIASDVGQAFGYTADQIDRVADVIATTATSANTNVSMMGETLKYAAPLAKAAGQSLELTAAAAGMLGNNGIKASMAGTDLAHILKQLASSSVQDKLAEMGVEVVDSEGKLRSLVDIMTDLDSALANTAPAERLAFMANTFGRAAKSAQILSSQNAGFAELETKIRDASGSAAEMARIMDDTIGGKLRGMFSALEGSMISLGEALEPALEPLIDDVTEFLKTSIEWIGQNEELVREILELTIGVTALGGALLIAGGTIKATGAIVGTLSTVLGTLTGVMNANAAAAVAMKAAMWGIGFAGLAAVIMGAKMALKGLNDELARGKELGDKTNETIAKQQQSKLAEIDALGIKNDPEFDKKLEVEIAKAQRDLEQQAVRYRAAENKRKAHGGWWKLTDRGASESMYAQNAKVLHDGMEQQNKFLEALEARRGGKIPSGSNIDRRPELIPDIPEISNDSPGLTGPTDQQRFVDDVLARIKTPEEKLAEFREKLLDALSAGDITDAQFDTAYAMKKQEVSAGDSALDSLKMFADGVKSQTDPLHDYKEQMEQLSAAVEAGLIDEKTASMYRKREGEQLAKRLDLEKTAERGTNRINKAVDANSSEGLGAVLAAAFKPSGNEQQQTKHLGAMVGHMVSQGKTLDQIKQFLAGQPAVKETEFKS